MRVTVRGNTLDYPGVTVTNTASLYNLKLLINSIIYTWHAWFLTLDITNYYYNTPMYCWEYM